ncbi:hypothetical protein MHU86_17190 [Fragilaria crotonensis]|nr:hypothetical protein MHU86_17190 [Fragilaria crotonensis]
MTLLTLSQMPLENVPLPLKADCISARQAESSSVSGPADDRDAVLQASNKKRRYQRRGSKAPSMMMLGMNSRLIHIDDESLIEIQRILLNDRDLLLSLEVADALEDQMASCNHGAESIDSEANSAVARNEAKKKRPVPT